MKKAITNKYILYTVCFWAFIGPLLAYIFSLGLVTIGTSDAISQIYPVMLYTKRLLDEFINSIFTGTKFTFPMLNTTLGMGDDNIAALNWHGFGDPFYLLSVFSSEQNLPYFYSILFYFRVYLGGGIAFIAMVSELDNKRSSAAYVIGALVYSFNGFTLQSNMHVIFVHAMLYIPLMFLGAERVINNKKRGLLLITTMCFALSGFYFLYIGSVSLAVYVIYRLLQRREKLKKALLKICELIAEYLLGLGVSAIIFIPGIVGFLGSDRAGIKSGLEFMMPWTEIRNLLINMFLPSYDSDQELAVCTIGVIIIVCVLLAKNKKREKINIALLFITAIIPLVSCVMSGFGECYERWELVLDMYIAYLTVSLWDELGELSIIQKGGVVLLYGGLGIYAKLEGILEHERFGQTIKAYGIILIAIVIIMPLSGKLKKEKIGKFLTFILVYITVCANWKVIARDREITILYERNAVEELLGNEQDSDFYRIDNERAFAEPKIRKNLSLYQGFNGVMEYVSIQNNSYASAFEKWGMSDTGHNSHGMDQRAVIETMSSVKYFVVRPEFAALTPYGFEYVKSTDDGEWRLYENKYALPIVYAYEKVYNEEAWHKIQKLDKQQVMLQAAAVENYDGTLDETEKYEDFMHEGEYILKNAQGEVLEGDIIKVMAGDVITLSARVKAGCENYLVFNTPVGVFSNVKLKTDVEYAKSIRPTSPITINLGAAETDKIIEADITVGSDADLDRAELKLMYYDFTNYEKYTDELSKDTKGKFAVETNSVKGNVDFDKNKMLCLAFPYSIGWHAKIDGKNVDIYRVNDLFIGIDVVAGEHNIEFHYITPGIRAGAAISALSIIIIVFTVMRRKKANHQ